MRKFHTVLGLGSLLAVAAATTSISPTIASARVVERTYVACNQYHDCWRVHRIYAYGKDVPITYYNGDWYEAHRADADIHWLPDPTDDRGYYIEDRTWHVDPAARAVRGGTVGAGLGAAIGCLVTLPVGCAPGAAVGAAVGGGAGAAAGVASTPPHD